MPRASVNDYIHDYKGDYVYKKPTMSSISYFSSVVTRGTIPSVLRATVPDQPY